MGEPSEKVNELYEQNKAYYERNADRYEAASWYYFNKYKSRAVSAELGTCLRALRGVSEINVLEIGPGTGYLLDKLLALEARPIAYTGIEHSTRMREILTERYGGRCKRFRLVPTSVTVETIESAIGAESFDLIIGSSILHHLVDYDRVVRVLGERLANGGVMYFVREPIHRRECSPTSAVGEVFYRLYGLVNRQLMKGGVRSLFWPGKVKAEDASTIAFHMYKDGVSIKPFHEMTLAGGSILFKRKYNRRVSTTMSYLENKWLGWWRKDVYGDTLFSIAVKKGNATGVVGP